MESNLKKQKRPQLSISISPELWVNSCLFFKEHPVVGMGERTRAHITQEAWLGCSLTLIMGSHVSSLGLSSLVGKVEGELGVWGEVEVKLHMTSYPSMETDICSGLPVTAQRVLTKTTPEPKNPMLLQQGSYLYVYYSFLPLKFATHYRNTCTKNDLYRVPLIILSHHGLICINNCHFKKRENLLQPHYRQMKEETSKMCLCKGVP